MRCCLSSPACRGNRPGMPRGRFRCQRQLARSRCPGLPRDQSPAVPPLLGACPCQTEAKGRSACISQTFSPISQAFLTFSALLWRLNPYLLQATKEGSSITIKKINLITCILVGFLYEKHQREFRLFGDWRTCFKCLNQKHIPLFSNKGPAILFAI